jgi:hypothetical protein
MRRGLVTAVAVGATLLIAGCTGGPTPNLQSLDSTSATAPSTTIVSSAPIDAAPPPSASALSNPTSTTAGAISASEEADRAAAEAQYTKFWQVYLALPHTPEDQWAAMLAPVAVEPMISNAQKDARSVINAGWDTYGEFGHRYSWPQPINGGDTALLTDCEDGSQTGALETATSNKKTVGTERSHKQGSLVRGTDGIWRVQGSFFIKGTPC